MTLRDQIAEQALTLPPEDRAYVADRIEQSLQLSGFATPEIVKAWGSEIDRRIEAYDKGESKASGFDEALGRIRNKLAKARLRR